MVLPIIFLSAIIILLIIAMWTIFVKAGKPGWASIIPIVNIAVIVEIIGKPWWWILLWFVPFLNIIWIIWSWNLLVKSFGKTEGFTVGVILLPIIFIPILAFGDAQYLGPIGENRYSDLDDITFKAKSESRAKNRAWHDETIIYEDFSTIRVPVFSQGPETLRLCRGRIVIQSGLDSGKYFELYGYPTGEGIVLSIGREHRDWKNYLVNVNHLNPDRLYAHILIPDPTKTLSRYQAELIYKTFGQLYLRNRGQVNPTIVNGILITVGQMVELRPGSIIKAGIVVLSYEL